MYHAIHAKFNVRLRVECNEESNQGHQVDHKLRFGWGGGGIKHNEEYNKECQMKHNVGGRG